MLIARLILALNSLGFTLFGLLFLFWPEAMIAKVGLQATAPAALIDIRATYGGMELGIAAMLGYCAVSIGGTAFGLFAATFAFAGLAIGRLVAIVLSGGASGFTWFLFTLEASSLILDVYALQRLKRDPHA